MPTTPAKPVSTAKQKLIGLFWSPTPEYMAHREFCSSRVSQKFPDWEAEQISVPDAQYGEKVLTMIAGGTPPDLIQLNFRWEPYFRDNDALEDVTPLLEVDPEFSLDDIYELLVELGKSEDGKRYSIPKGWNPFVVYYNRTRFQEAALPDIPTDWQNTTWTWETFVETARKVTVDSNNDGRVDTYGVFFPSWYAFVLLNGADVLSADQKEVTIGDAAAVEALEYVANLRIKHRVAPTPADIAGQGSDQDLFTSERVAMFIAGAYAIARLLQIKDFEWEVGVPPRAPGKPPVAYTQYYGHGIPKGVKNLKMSWEYIKLFSDEEANRHSVTLGDSVPANIKVATGKDFGEAPPPPTRKVFLDGSAYVKVWPLVPPIREIMDGILQPELDLAFTGEQTVRAAVDNATPRAQKRLDEYWAKHGQS